MAIAKCLIIGWFILILEINPSIQGQVIRLDVNNHPDVIVVPIGEKIILRCSSSPNEEVTWYKGGDVFRHHRPSSRIRMIKQLLKFKYVEPEDTDSYGCLVRSNLTDRIEWRNVTIRAAAAADSLQNDGYHEHEERLGITLGAHNRAAEEETNELEAETRNLPETRALHLVDNNSENAEADLDNEKSSMNETAGDHNNTAPERAPSFNKSVEMSNVVVKPAGNMLRLRCPSFGNPWPNITWLKNNEEPKRTLGSVIVSKWTFRLEDLVPEDSGNYTCVVCNYLGCINRTFKVEIVGECYSFFFYSLKRAWVRAYLYYCVPSNT